MSDEMAVQLIALATEMVFFVACAFLGVAIYFGSKDFFTWLKRRRKRKQ